jgi:hypothetical protein
MKINTFKMLPLAKSLLEFLQTGVDAGSIIFDEQGIAIDLEKSREQIADKLIVQMKNWKPIYQDKELLDEPTRIAGARFLAGIAISLLKKE